MHGPRPFGNEPVDWLPDSLPCRTSEHLLRGGVEVGDAFGLINGDDAVHGRGNNSTQSGFTLLHGLLSLLTLGDVARDTRNADDLAARDRRRGTDKEIAA